MRIKHIARTISLALLFVLSLGTRGGGQSTPSQREAQIKGAIAGAFVGAAAGAAIGYVLGSLAVGEPACLVDNPCKSESHAGAGARIGLAIGIPIGAVRGWRRGGASVDTNRAMTVVPHRNAMRLPSPSSSLPRPSHRRPLEFTTRVMHIDAR
jgi:hypothetical protein